jgi:hypothetical protein
MEKEREREIKQKEQNEQEKQKIQKAIKGQVQWTTEAERSIHFADPHVGSQGHDLVSQFPETC